MRQQISQEQLIDRLFFCLLSCVCSENGRIQEKHKCHSLASIYFNIIPCGLTWSVSWNGSHLYTCCCLEWPQASSCGGEIKLKFCHLEADNEINSLASKKSCQQSCSQGNQGDLPTADFGASQCWDSGWAGGPCSLLCVVALSAAVLEQRGWRPNLQPSGRALLRMEKGVNRTGFSSSLDVRSIYHLTKTDLAEVASSSTLQQVKCAELGRCPKQYPEMKLLKVALQ